MVTKVKVDPYLQNLYQKVEEMHDKRMENDTSRQKYRNLWKAIKNYRRYGYKYYF